MGVTVCYHSDVELNAVFVGLAQVMVQGHDEYLVSGTVAAFVRQKLRGSFKYG